MIGKDKAFRIMEDALEHSKSDETEVVLMGHNHCLTRYANSQIHQNMAEVDSSLLIKAVVGKKIGVTSLNDFNSDKIIEAVGKAYRIALRLKDIDDFKGLPKKMEIPEISTYFPRTAEINAEEKALIVQDMIIRTHGDRMALNGAFYTGVSEIAVANSHGVRAYNIGTMSDLTALTSSSDASGYAGASSRNVDDLDYIRLVEESLDSAKKYGEVRTLEPGKYPVILEGYAVADMLMFLSYISFSSESVQDGHSFIVPNKGKKLFNDDITIYDDGLNPAIFMMPFDFEGTPKRRIDFIRKGVVTGKYTHNSYTAGKEGQSSTGHAMPSTIGLTKAYPTQIVMENGTSSREEMVKEMGRGLLVKRFHYLTAVHPLKTIISGMTRNGVFLIENGQIKARVNNMRFTQSVIESLKNVKAISSERKLIWLRDFSLDFPIAFLVPKYLFIENFSFTGQTEF